MGTHVVPLEGMPERHILCMESLRPHIIYKAYVDYHHLPIVEMLVDYFKKINSRLLQKGAKTKSLEEDEVTELISGDIERFAREVVEDHMSRSEGVTV